MHATRDTDFLLTNEITRHVNVTPVALPFPEAVIAKAKAQGKIKVKEKENETRAITSTNRDAVSRNRIAEVVVHHIKVEDVEEDEQKLLEAIPKAVTFIEDALQHGRNVLVNCHEGVSRSATVVAAYLMKKESVGPIVALEMLREKRPVVSPNAGFLLALDSWGQMLKFQKVQ